MLGLVFATNAVSSGLASIGRMATTTRFGAVERSRIDDFFAESVARFDVPGAALGMTCAGAEHVAVAGVTSVADPLPITADTLFMIGSTSKTFTATTALSLVEEGLLDLGRPVHEYLPALLDCPVDVRPLREAVVVRDLLTHTAGWQGDVGFDTGRGDDALARVVSEVLPQLPQHTPPGSSMSYNNVSSAVLARLVEVATGEVYETVLRDRLVAPLGLGQTFLYPEDVANRRHAVGHTSPGGVNVPAAEWPLPRCFTPVGGIASSVLDQLAYARFHLSGASAGVAPITGGMRAMMRAPRVRINETQHVGLSWLLRRRGDRMLVTHGGNVSYQHVSSFVMSPDADFAMTVLTNGQSGQLLNAEVVNWVLANVLGEPEFELAAMPGRGADELAEYVGDYEAADSRVEVRRGGSGLTTRLRYPEVPDFDWPAQDVYFVSRDTVATTANPAEAAGEFIRDGGDGVTGLRWGLRLAHRATGPAAAEDLVAEEKG